MQATAPIEGVGLDQYIRAKARLEHDPHALDAVIELLSLPDAEAWRRVDGGWRERMEKNERLARVVGEFLDDYIHELRGVRAAAEGEAEDDEAEYAPAPEPVRREVPSYMQAQVSGGDRRAGSSRESTCSAPASGRPGIRDGLRHDATAARSTEWSRAAVRASSGRTGRRPNCVHPQALADRRDGASPLESPWAFAGVLVARRHPAPAAAPGG